MASRCEEWCRAPRRENRRNRVFEPPPSGLSDRRGSLPPGRKCNLPVRCTQMQSTSARCVMFDNSCVQQDGGHPVRPCDKEMRIRSIQNCHLSFSRTPCQSCRCTYLAFGRSGMDGPRVPAVPWPGFGARAGSKSQFYLKAKPSIEQPSPRVWRLPQRDRR